MRRTALITQALLVAMWPSLAQADDADNNPAEPASTAGAVLDAQQIVALARSSIAVVSVKNREGGELGVGTGFVVGADGLIATNLHVIGEARPIWVRLADGRSFEVRSVHASDRALDLAVIRVDANDLKPLRLGDSDTLRQGQALWRWETRSAWHTAPGRGSYRPFARSRAVPTSRWPCRSSPGTAAAPC